MPKYIIVGAVTEYIEYTVEAESKEQARRIFEDDEDPEGNFDAVHGDDKVYEFVEIRAVAPQTLADYLDSTLEEGVA